MYDDDHTEWKAQQARHKAWMAEGGNGKLSDFKTGAVKQELTVAQKKAALQAQIDALG